MIAKAVLILLLLIPSSFPVAAKVHEGLSIERCAKLATDIVVATEGDSIDGHIIVLETLKGELNPGENLVIPELAGFSFEEARTIGCLGLPPRADDMPMEKQYVTGSRMILFLRKNSMASDENRTSTDDLPLWVGIDDRSIYQSIIWIEGKHTFAFYDVTSFDGVLKSERGTLADFESSEDEIIFRISSALEN
jgi:hypothetical protein